MIELRTYQEKAVEKAESLKGFLLADEMGLGKTVVQCEECRRYRERIGHLALLVVTKKSVIDTWVDHITMFMPNLPMLVADNSHRGKTQEFIKEHPDRDFAVVTNWDQLRINPVLRKTVWDYFVADEVQDIKNRKTKRTRAAKSVPAIRRRGLTGTPVINRPDDLWSILNWLYPDLFRSYWRFFHEYCAYDQVTLPTGQQYKVVKGPKNADQLRETIKPFAMRRLKKNHLPELPDKYYTTILVDMTPPQRRIYEEMRKEAIAWVGLHEDEPVAARMAIAKLMRLRQFCTAYATLVDGTVQLSEPSSKLDAMMDILEDGQPTVVFSNFRKLIRLVEARLQKAKMPFSILTGDVPQEARGQQIRDFQEGATNVILGTLRAGGIGVTLHRASTVVFLDRSWSPADNLQAEDRLHRFGQKNAVQVINIETRNSVDRVVEKTLEWKWNTIKAILTEEDF